VDILICTPGRLMDHLNGTPNFTLQHLRFLVIDEADRLLAQSFQDWLTQALAVTRPPAHVEAGAISEEASISYPDALSPAFLHLLRGSYRPRRKARVFLSKAPVLGYPNERPWKNRCSGAQKPAVRCGTVLKRKPRIGCSGRCNGEV